MFQYQAMLEDALASNDEVKAAIAITMLAECDGPDDKYNIPVIMAVHFNSPNSLRMLLRHSGNPDAINPLYGMNDTALIQACKHGYAECAKILLEADADLNGANSDGITALMYACMYNYPKCVDLLLQCGADPELQDKDNNTALDIAKIKRHQECIELLEKCRKRLTWCCPPRRKEIGKTSTFIL